MDGRAAMTTLPAPASTPRKILGRTSLKIQMGAACLAVLGLGSWLSPKPAAHALPASEERAAPLLEEQSHARTATGLARALDEIVSSTRDHAVRFPPAGAPPRLRVADFEAPSRPAVPAFGVRLSDTRVLTHVDALPPATTVPGWGADGVRFEAAVTAFDPTTGLVLLAVPATGATPAALGTDEMRPGALVVGVGRSDRGDVVVPVIVTAVDAGRLQLGGAALSAGLPLYDLEGRLVAIAAGRDGAGAFAVAPALARLGAPSGGGRPLLSVGIALQARSGGLLQVYGPTGVVVDDVVVDGPGHRAGIEPGDLILEVDGAVVDDPATALSAIQAAAARGPAIPVRVRSLGSRQVRSVEIAAEPAVVVAVLGRRWRPDTAPPEARSLFPPAALDAAGVAASSRVLAIDGTALRSRDDVVRAARRRRTPLVVVLADQRGRFVAAIEGSR